MKNLLLILVLGLGINSFLSAQSWNNRNKIKGEGPVVKKKLDIDEFNKIGLAFNAKVYLTKGNQQSVEIEAQQNIIDNIETEVKKGAWNIKFNQRVKDRKPIIINITIPDIRALSIAGSGDIIGKSAFENLEQLDLSIAGSGNIELTGSVQDMKVSIAGSGDIKAEKFKANNCEVSIAGSGDCYVHVDSDLKISIAGGGDVNYKGNPKIKSSIAGGGKVRSL